MDFLSGVSRPCVNFIMNVSRCTAGSPDLVTSKVKGQSCFPRVLFSPAHMIMVPPRHYCVIANPVARDDQGQVLFDQSGQAKLRHADLEIRLPQDPFPLYPGEETQQVLSHSLTHTDSTPDRRASRYPQTPFSPPPPPPTGSDPPGHRVSQHSAEAAGAAGL